MRRGRLLAAAAGAVLVLAGCSEIPTTGPVENGSSEGPNDTTIVYLPNPPAQGASPREIVTGFLTAASAGGDLHVAREFLTPDLEERWDPRSRVLVQEAQPTITTRGVDQLTLQMPVSATVRADGTYTPASRVVPLDFRLERQNGQWRISSAPDGIVLAQTVFQKTYVPRTLEFFDPTFTRLVPDLRWFPATDDDATSGPSSEAIVDALIAGPAGPIAHGVTANALSGATLLAVSSSGSDITTVALNLPLQDVTAESATRMQQQLVQSLQLGTPSALRLVLNGRAAPQAKALASRPAPFSGYAVKGGRFGALGADGALTEEPTLGKRIVALDPQAVTVSPRQHIAAVLTGGTDVAVVTPDGVRTVDRRADLVAPTLDQRGWVYSVPADGTGALRAWDGKGRSVDVVGDLGGSTVTAIEVSPDGTRLLALVQSASGPKAFVAGIQRAADGAPMALTGDRYPVDLDGTTGTGIDATWVDEGEVAVLSSAPDNSTDRVQVQQLGALATPLGQLANATAVVGTTSETDLRVQLQTGDLWVWNGNLWQRESSGSTGVSVLAVQR